MLTYEAPGGTKFSHHSDLSGAVGIVREHETGWYWVKASDLLAFVAEVVRNQRIDALEAASHAEVLGLPSTPSEARR